MSAETINMRTDAERKRRLQLAADLTHESLTGFVLSAADERADRVIAAAHTIELPTAFFDEFFDALASEPTSVLVDAARRLDTNVHRGG